MLNNVIDHSEGTKVEFDLKQCFENLVIHVRDDGIGIFQKNMLAFGCNDTYEAVVETFKGKRTSDPEHQAGEDIFFTSRLFDYFSVRANNLFWQFHSKTEDWSITKEKTDMGTELFFGINKFSKRTPKEIFEQYTDENHEYSKGSLLPVEPLNLKAGIEHVSRSEARRLLIGIEKFKNVQIDFRNTKTIGQGFADEVFRVFNNKYPNTKFVPINMNSIVETMVSHVSRK